MATAQLIGKEQARAKAMASIEAMERRFAVRMEEVIRETDTFIKSLTPVNTGQAVRNYIWSQGSPNKITFDPIDNGPTGRTNAMELGSEPRRWPNEEAAAQSIDTLNFRNPFQTFYLTNNSPDIEGLELGILPGPPYKSRSPNGMFGITHAFINAKVAQKGMMK
jgi:hypothetical protein